MLMRNGPAVRTSPKKLDALFDPALFRQYLDLVSSRLTHYLADHSIRGLALSDPRVLQQTAQALTDRPAAGDTDEDARLAAILDLYIRTGIQLYSPGYMGRQFSGPLPLAAVVDLASSVLNQPASFYEAAQLPNIAERIMADELNRFVGFAPQRFAMVTTSGGSLANLTALLAARNDRLPHAWAEGLADATHPRPAIAISADAHYSICRAAGILGIGERQIIRLPIDRERRIDIAAVGPALEAARQRGLRPFCLVGSAGSTSVGAIDPIDQLADIAAEQNLWLHIDGAHGASLLLCDHLRHRLQGIARADSLTWDAHKLLFVPAACTLLFYKDKDKARGAFRQDASYVFDKHGNGHTDYEGADKNLECTKRAMIMPLWVSWAMYGAAPFADKIALLCRATADAEQIIASEPDFDTLHVPQANILCFRYRPAGLPESRLGDFQIEIRDLVRAKGDFFISQVELDGVAALRLVMMNHEVEPSHVRLLLRQIRKIGNAILAHSTGQAQPEVSQWV